MIRVFIDASVLFSACLSPTGASREIIRHAIREKVVLVASELVFEEVRRNLSAKAPDALPIFDLLLDTIPFEIVEPTKREILKAAQYTAFKDAAIVAAAKRAGVDYLVSLDRQHLVGIPEVARRSGLTITLPERLLEKIRSQSGGK